jgi:hypothetical protein
MASGLVTAPAFSSAFRLAGRPGAELAALAAVVDGDPDDLDSILRVLAVTDPRARDASGAFAALPPAAQYRGPSAAAVMMPFLCPSPSRFSSGIYGVLYGAAEIATAAAEVSYHNASRLRKAHATPGATVILAEWVFTLSEPLVDLCGADAALYDPKDYTAAQVRGKQIRDAGARGVLYTSVRHASGRCSGIFVPNTVETMQKRDDWRLVWDGRTISEVLRVVV